MDVVAEDSDVIVVGVMVGSVEKSTVASLLLFVPTVLQHIKCL